MGKFVESLRAFSRECGGVTVIVVIVGDTVMVERGSVCGFVDVKQSEAGEGVRVVPPRTQHTRGWAARLCCAATGPLQPSPLSPCRPHPQILHLLSYD